ncbi:c-type cytochrome [Chitinophaga horti]|uniref:C-type cytochrome n=1 Tax=Chitinophaga horti TaxID=2920382 RepID=A0ABY6J4T9_9BACT|nr:c-type cytochrome [Chitinophaga horti]UYQ94688.1 c-type cytochrome [Chitinophaga horti]
MKIRSQHLLLPLLLSLLAGACKQHSTPEQKRAADSLAARKEFASSPVLSAQESLAQLHVEKGFDITLAASEPLVVAPVAMSFDERGRMWVVEMMGYMPDTVGTGEDMRNGSIAILEDTNKDGVADKRTVFLDSLVLPRAVCLIENGVLVAVPPYLWYIERNGDAPGRRTLVDSTYAVEGNVEHQPNGLLRAMDNWIYNAKSDKRYRKKGNQWLIEKTHFRGQWGISQDNYGRLYVNNNSVNLEGDYFPPGFGAGNSSQRDVGGYTERVVRNNRVYPMRATPGVNRGYTKNTLTDSLRLANFTAACGPLVYRGALFGAAYDNNAFVAEPAGNLIKRNILKDSGYAVTGRQAYADSEFVASTDERFRPVNLSTGPDGAIYVLDMYRGIIQHKTYLTDYLKNEIRMRNLSLPLNCGRIYRIAPKGKAATMPDFNVSPAGLVALLDHPNGWVRDMAQQLLVDRRPAEAIAPLKARLANTAQPIGALHALWTLEGMNALDFDLVRPLLLQGDAQLKQQAMATLPAVLNNSNQAAIIALLKTFDADPRTAPMLGYLLPFLRKYDAPAADNLLTQLSRLYADDRYVADALISAAPGREKELLQSITAWNSDTALVINKRLQKVLRDISESKKAKLSEAVLNEYPRGYKIFTTVCQTCHGPDGNGIQSLAPPLNESQWVNGERERLIAIVLFGLTGPVEVNGKVYKAPEISGDMPGIGNNDEFSDADIAQLLSFLRKAWSNNADKITDKDVKATRLKLKGRQKAFTVEELLKL